MEAFLNNRSKSEPKKGRGRPAKQIMVKTASEGSASSSEPSQVNRGGRPRKEVVYKVQRREVLDKLNTILGITDKNNVFSLTELDKDQKRIDQIMALKDDIAEYFRGKDSAVYKNNAQKPFLSLLKIVYRDFDYRFDYATKRSEGRESMIFVTKKSPNNNS